jgi:hypothetical protein
MWIVTCTTTFIIQTTFLEVIALEKRIQEFQIVAFPS